MRRRGSRGLLHRKGGSAYAERRITLMTTLGLGSPRMRERRGIHDACAIAVRITPRMRKTLSCRYCQKTRIPRVCGKTGVS